MTRYVDHLDIGERAGDFQLDGVLRLVNTTVGSLSIPVVCTITIDGMAIAVENNLSALKGKEIAGPVNTGTERNVAGELDSRAIGKICERK